MCFGHQHCAAGELPYFHYTARSGVPGDVEVLYLALSRAAERHENGGYEGSLSPVGPRKFPPLSAPNGSLRLLARQHPLKFDLSLSFLLPHHNYQHSQTDILPGFNTFWSKPSSSRPSSGLSSRLYHASNFHLQAAFVDLSNISRTACRYTFVLSLIPLEKQTASSRFFFKSVPRSPKYHLQFESSPSTSASDPALTLQVHDWTPL